MDSRGRDRRPSQAGSRYCTTHNVPLPALLSGQVSTFMPVTRICADQCRRVNVGNARIQGMEKDLRLDIGYRFNWVTSIFYIVYMFVEIHSNIILKKIGPKYYLPLLVCGFGFVSLCSAFVQSFGGLLVARAFLGVFEGGVMP